MFQERMEAERLAELERRDELELERVEAQTEVLKRQRAGAA